MFIQKLATFYLLSRAAGLSSVLRWRLLRKNTIFTANIAGITVKLRARTSDLPIAIECLTSEYEAIAPLFPPDFAGVIIDAGAHIGCAALRLATLFPSARIICIEPSTDNVLLLRENTQFFPCIEIRKAALVAKAAGLLTLSDRGRGGSGYTVVENSHDTPNMSAIENVETIAITDLLNEFGPHIGFIKLDIEGAEQSILSSEEFRDFGVPAIFVELHERIRPGCVQAFASFSEDRRWNVRVGQEKYLSLLRDTKVLREIAPDDQNFAQTGNAMSPVT